MKPYEPRSFKEGLALLVLMFIAAGTLVIWANLGGWYWVLPTIGVPASLYGMWRVGGWEE